MADKKPIQSISDMTVGDVVWVYDTERSRYNTGGHYVGRGAWFQSEIKSSTRSSVSLLGNYKFNQKTGEQIGIGGNVPTHHIYGEIEKSDQVWRQRASEISRKVRNCDDPNALEQIAKLVGFRNNDPKRL